MLQLLSERIKDGRVISLINKILRAKIIDGKEVTKPKMGLTQGAPCSPVLANILLDQLDKELESRNHKFIRYADDMVILCGSKKAAERILANVTKFVEGKLFLKVNTEKTKILQACEDSQFLGFAFTQKVKARKKKEFPTQRFFAVVHKKKRVKLAESWLV